MKLTVTQKSQSGQSVNVDNLATIVDVGDYVRIMYKEKNGAEVSMDIMSHELLLTRNDAWVTKGTFHRDVQSALHVTNEHGTLIFDVDVEEMWRRENTFYIRYRLSQSGNGVDTLELKCWWEPEV